VVVPSANQQANAQTQPPNLVTGRDMIEAEIAKLPTPEHMEEVRQRYARDVESKREKLAQSVAEIRPLVSPVFSDYEALARDPKAQAVVDEMNRGEKARDQARPVS
jgi:hypothetical protein